MVKFCPMCSKKGKVSKMKFYQINLTEATIMCENVECPFPYLNGVKTVVFKRDFKLKNDPVASLKALAEYQKNFQKSRITGICDGDYIDGTDPGTSSQIIDVRENSVHCSGNNNISKLESKLITNCWKFNNSTINSVDIVNNLEHSDYDICKLVDSSSISKAMIMTEHPVSEVNGSQHVNNKEVSPDHIISKTADEVIEEVMDNNKKGQKSVSNDTCMYECVSMVKNTKIFNVTENMNNFRIYDKTCEHNFTVDNVMNSKDILNDISSDVNEGSEIEFEKRVLKEVNDINVKGIVHCTKQPEILCSTTCKKDVDGACDHQNVRSFNKSDISNSISSPDATNIFDTSSVLNKIKSLQFENEKSYNATSITVVSNTKVPLVSINSNVANRKDYNGESFLNVGAVHDAAEGMKGKHLSFDVKDTIKEFEPMTGINDFSLPQFSNSETYQEIDGFRRTEITHDTKLQDVVSDATHTDVINGHNVFSNHFVKNINSSEFINKMDNLESSNSVGISPVIDETENLDIESNAICTAVARNTELSEELIDSNISIIKDDNSDSLVDVAGADDAKACVKLKDVSLNTNNSLKEREPMIGINDFSLQQFFNDETCLEIDGNDDLARAKLMCDTKLQDIISDSTSTDVINRPITDAALDTSDHFVNNINSSQFMNEISTKSSKSAGILPVVNETENLDPIESFVQKNPECLKNCDDKYFNLDNSSNCANDPEISICKRSTLVVEELLSDFSSKSFEQISNVTENGFKALEEAIDNKNNCHMQKGNNTILSTFDKNDGNPCCVGNANNTVILGNTCEGDKFSHFVFSKTDVILRKRKVPAKIRGIKRKRKKK